jgi:DNA-directed RNA polymerase specialized sigma24 family protein
LFDRNAPTSQLVFAELAKEGVRERLLRYAKWRTGDDDEAKDLVADALEVVCDPEKKKPWDPAKRSLFRHMRRVMDDLAIYDTRAGAGRFEINESGLIAKTGDPEALPDQADDHDLPDEQVAAKRDLAWLRGLAEILLERLSGRGDDKAIAVYEAACIHEEPAEQARHLGIPVEEVYEAHRRLRHHGLIVKAEWERAEAERMAALRRRRKISQEKPS